MNWFGIGLEKFWTLRESQQISQGEIEVYGLALRGGNICRQGFTKLAKAFLGLHSSTG